MLRVLRLPQAERGRPCHLEWARFCVVSVLFLAVATGFGCGGKDTPTAPKPAPVGAISVSTGNQDAIAAVTSVQFSAGGSTSSAGGITGYSWDFGDGTSANGASVQHTFNSAGTKNVRLTVTDANGTGSASATVIVKDLTGTWRAQFNVQTRTYTLTQNNSVLSGTYTNSHLLGQVWPLGGSVDASRRLTITATYPGEQTVILSNATIDSTANSFTGITTGGSANGQILTYTRQ